MDRKGKGHSKPGPPRPSNGPRKPGSAPGGSSSRPAGDHRSRRPAGKNNIEETFKFNARTANNDTGEGSSYAAQQPRNLLVSKYELESTAALKEDWRKLPEIPTVEELNAEAVDLSTNVIDGPYESVEEFLHTHYELLREDAVAGLREAVSYIRENPCSDDTQDVAIYENVRVIGMTFSPSVGMCMKVTFSLNRAGKRIRWAASKRLVPGSLLCISDDEFKTFKVVTVAARPLLGLEENPPELDIHFLPDEVEIDTSKTFVMIEARSSYFEAYKWVLKSLQRMHANQFPLKEQICFLDNEMTTPAYVRLNPTYNLTTVFPDTPDREGLEEVNILKQWPKVSTSMDDTQLMALKSILTNPVSVIQGPPGTGKTYTSVMALNAILQNMTEDDPPIIVACQTNHALDQILRHILKFESNIVRLGGRTQDREEILARTLYHVRRKSVITVQNGYNRARTALNNVHTSITSAIDPLCADLINPKDLLALKLINKKQQESFTLGSQDWIQAHEEDKLQTPIASWLGEAVEPIPIEEDLCPEMEEGDVEYEMLKDLEAEFLGTGDDEEETDALYGPFKSMKHNFRVRCPIGMPEKEILKASRTQNVWDIPEHIRPAVYTRWHKVATAKIYEKVRKLNIDNQKAVLNFKIAKMERDSAILSSAKLVGMTTTGLSKYRSLVASTMPKVVLIEEAAEALEGPTVIACMPTVQQLILVGDHKQLRGKCSVKELDDEPYNLNVSLFERWVLNEMPYITLRMQRRMRPEIREILAPIYGDQLLDHPSVMGREPIQGMGTLNMYWNSHTHSEDTMSDTPSRMNLHEASMINKFCEYLILNGTSPSSITILTFYTGQRSLIAKLLRKNANFQGTYIKIATVDSYQGEENDIIMLSLVRSNFGRNIGFLSVSNRVCVALSRAQRGFYIFGNANMLTSVDSLWWDVANILADKSPSRIGAALSLTCHRHKNITSIEHLSDWDNICGGCKDKCTEKLPCGHKCPNTCHPFDHEDYRCVVRCKKVLPCKHRCDQECWEVCYCEGCGKTVDEMEEEEIVDVEPTVGRVVTVSAGGVWAPGARKESPAKKTVRTVRTPKVRTKVEA